MINPSTIKTCLSGLIGFAPALDQGLPTIDADLQASESGIIVQEVHSLITIEHILACIENGANITLPSVWSDATTYSIGQKVTVGSTNANKVIYISLTNNNLNNDPEEEDSEDWELQGNYLCQYLRAKLNQAAVNLANAVYLHKNLNQNAKSILGDMTLYSGSGSIHNTIEKRSRFVGFKIFIKGSDLAVILSKIGLQISELNPEFKLYLYHSSQLEPVKQWDLTHSKAYSFQWITITNQIMSFLNSDINPGGHYSIGYYEDDLVGNAIERKTNLTNWTACSSCDEANRMSFRKWNQYITVQPFYVDSGDLNEDRTLWDEEQENIIDDQNWGMNLQLSIACDSTDIFCRNKSSIAYVYALQTAICILSDMAYGSRDNQKFQKVSQLAMYALEDRQNSREPGLKSELKQAIKALSFNFSSMNKACLPCDESNNTIEYTTIY